MRRVARGGIALFLLVAWALPCHDAEARRKSVRLRGAGAEARSEPAAEADSVRVRGFVDAGNADFIRAWMTGDADLFAGCFARDGALLHPGRPAVVGRDGIRERMNGVFAKYRMRAGEITTVDLFILGDTAYETGKWKFAIGPIGQPAAPDSGRYVEVWKREGDAWRMWRDIGVPK
ncbi:MAG TPA: nuclear transport factor 2 family protein [Candidatus Eisenbacteria bacterium]|jgi:uncharacterized protein (TIGR02246 family)